MCMVHVNVVPRTHNLIHWLTLDHFSMINKSSDVFNVPHNWSN